MATPYFLSTFNLPNKSPTRQVIEFQEPTEQNYYTWYRLYDDGWVEQGGQMNTPDSDYKGTVSLPVEMANTKYTINTTSTTGNQHANMTAISGSVSTTSFDIQVTNKYYNAASPTITYWQVCGMSARGATQQNILCIKY